MVQLYIMAVRLLALVTKQKECSCCIACVSFSKHRHYYKTAR